MKLESMKQLKTFNQWMHEEVASPHGTEKRFAAFQPDVIPHPIILADHVWNECAKVYTLRLDSFLSQLRIIMGNDVRATAFINSFKEEMVKCMVSNAVGFTKEEPVQTDEPLNVFERGTNDVREHHKQIDGKIDLGLTQELSPEKTNVKPLKLV